MKLIVAGGGTGGHVFGGVAIAQAWKKRFGKDAPILFVGAKGGIEERSVPKAGFSLELLTLGSLKGVSWGKRVRTLILLPVAILKSAMILLRFKPNAVIGVGGYASGPLVMTARLLGWIWGCRVGILEQNSVPGLTNRILSRFVHVVLSAFPGIESRFKGKTVVVTGNPVRDQIKPMPPAQSSPFVIFVFGGSQGAKGVNTLLLEALTHLQDLKPTIKIIHQTGELDYERVKAAHAALGFNVEVQKFINDMVSAYRQSSLVICRAGSSTLFEIAAVSRAAVFIPFPYAADNHQEVNARMLVERGAAELMIQFQSTGEQLASKIRDYIEHPDKLQTMEMRVREFYKPDAADAAVRALVE